MYYGGIIVQAAVDIISEALMALLLAFIDLPESEQDAILKELSRGQDD